MQRKPVVSGIGCVLRILVFPVLIGQILGGNTGYVYLCVLTLLLMELPGWAERQLSVMIPGPLEGMILLFLFSSEILGEIKGCYVRFPVWDGLLHGFSGFLFAAVGYVLPELMIRQGRETNPGLRLVFAVCFSVTVGVVWEFLEWGVDGIFGLDMQKDTVVTALRSVCLDPRGGNAVGAVSGVRDAILLLADGSRVRLGLGGYLDVGLHDTMGDLLLDLAGALIFTVLSRWGKAADFFIPIIQSQEER